MRNASVDLRFRDDLPPQLAEETVRAMTESHAQEAQSRAAARALEAKSRAKARASEAKSGAVRDVVLPVLAVAAVVALVVFRPRP